MASVALPTRPLSPSERGRVLPWERRLRCPISGEIGGLGCAYPCDACRPYWKYVQGSRSFPDRLGAMTARSTTAAENSAGQSRERGARRAIEKANPAAWGRWAGLYRLLLRAVIRSKEAQAARPARRAAQVRAAADGAHHDRQVTGTGNVRPYNPRWVFFSSASVDKLS